MCGPENGSDGNCRKRMSIIWYSLIPYFVFDLQEWNFILEPLDILLKEEKRDGDICNTQNYLLTFC